MQSSSRQRTYRNHKRALCMVRYRRDNDLKMLNHVRLSFAKANGQLNTVVTGIWWNYGRNGGNGVVSEVLSVTGCVSSTFTLDVPQCIGVLK